MSESTATIRIDVLRYRPEQEDAPAWQSYVVPCTDDMSVLQALQHVKDEQDGTLGFRWSCRMAICGSCGMMVNGTPALACKTFLRDLRPGPVRIEALAHFPIERDLIVSVDPFVRKLEGIKPYLVPRTPRSLADGEYLQTPVELERKQPLGVPSLRMVIDVHPLVALLQLGQLVAGRLHRLGRAVDAATLFHALRHFPAQRRDAFPAAFARDEG